MMDLSTDKVRDTPCPSCGEKQLTITMRDRLTVKSIGEFSLAGQTMKYSASGPAPWPFLQCGACKVGAWAKRD